MKHNFLNNLNGKYLKFYFTENENLPILLKNTGSLTIVNSKDDNNKDYFSIYVADQLITQGIGLSIDVKKFVDDLYKEYADKIGGIEQDIDNIKDSYVKSNGGDITNTTITYTLKGKGDEDISKTLPMSDIIKYIITNYAIFNTKVNSVKYVIKYELNSQYYTKEIYNNFPNISLENIVTLPYGSTLSSVTAYIGGEINDSANINLLSDVNYSAKYYRTTDETTQQTYTLNTKVNLNEDKYVNNKIAFFNKTNFKIQHSFVDFSNFIINRLDNYNYNVIKESSLSFAYEGEPLISVSLPSLSIVTELPSIIYAYRDNSNNIVTVDDKNVFFANGNNEITFTNSYKDLIIGIAFDKKLTHLDRINKNEFNDYSINMISQLIPLNKSYIISYESMNEGNMIYNLYYVDINRYYTETGLNYNMATGEMDIYKAILIDEIQQIATAGSTYANISEVYSSISLLNKKYMPLQINNMAYLTIDEPPIDFNKLRKFLYNINQTTI